MRRYYILLLVLFTLLFCSKDDRVNTPPQMMEPGDDTNIVNILFIGNSLTYFNEGVDFHVQQFYDSSTETIVSNSERATSPGASLRNHLNSPATLNKISSKDWDYIVLQENGVVATTNPEEMITSVTAFKDILDTTNAEVFFYLTWAYDGMPEMTNQLVTIYNEAATLTGYKIIPVGLGWRDFQTENNGTNLLGPDGVHPSLEGTYFASAMLFKALSNQNVSMNSYRATLTPEKAQMLKEFATEAFLIYY